MILSVVIIIIGNILDSFLKHWIFRSIGFGICGLLYLIHPVIPQNGVSNKYTLWSVRLAGVLLILIGIFTRASY